MPKWNRYLGVSKIEIGGWHHWHELAETNGAPEQAGLLGWRWCCGRSFVLLVPSIMEILNKLWNRVAGYPVKSVC
jgi:hypothetical protein